MSEVRVPPIQHVVRLAMLGPHPVGSDANQAATDYIRSLLAETGYAVDLQTYDCPYWECAEIRLEVLGQRLEAAGIPYSPACDLEAETVACSTLAELQAAEISGKILLVHGALASQPTTPAYVVYASGPDPVIELLKEKKPAALIAIESNPHNAFVFIEDWTFPIPSALVYEESGRTLLQAVGSPARLCIKSRTGPSTAANVVAHQPGRGSKRIVICAHFDTAYGTPGAFDNASGTAVLLDLAQRFYGRELACGLEFVAFNGEDSGGVDFTPYAEKCGDFENMLAVINIDGVADWLGTTSITTLGGAPEFEALARQVAAERTDLAWVDPWYESDHSMFFFHGVPAVAISTRGHASLLHRAWDKVDWINPEKLERVVNLVETLIERLSA